MTDSFADGAVHVKRFCDNKHDDCAHHRHGDRHSSDDELLGKCEGHCVVPCGLQRRDSLPASGLGVKRYFANESKLCLRSRGALVTFSTEGRETVAPIWCKDNSPITAQVYINGEPVRTGGNLACGGGTCVLGAPPPLLLCLYTFNRESLDRSQSRRPSPFHYSIPSPLFPNSFPNSIRFDWPPLWAGPIIR